MLLDAVRSRNLGIGVTQLVLYEVVEFDIIQYLIAYWRLLEIWVTSSDEFFKCCLNLNRILINLTASFAFLVSSWVELV